MRGNATIERGPGQEQAPRQPDAPRRVFVHTFGCQMNVYDSERMVQLLERPTGSVDAAQEHYRQTTDPAEADLILINTCSVRERPQAKVMSAVGRYALLKANNPELLIGVTGCVAAQLGDELTRGTPAADLVIGPDRVGELVDIVAEARQQRSVVRTEEIPVDDYEFVEARPLVAGSSSVSAMVTAMKGCNQFCSYCIVPYVRGREVSKPPEQIVREVERMVAGGVREIMLLGQNVNRYGLDLDDSVEFPELLRRIAAIPGVDRLRFTTSHPKDCSDELIACFGDIPELCEYFHLPFQAGDDEVLRRMRRGYTRDQYLETARKLRERAPGLHLSADVIVGFPGETEEQFEQTLDIIRQVRFGSLFYFKYSPRPGTRAAKEADDVSEAEKSRRLQAVDALQAEMMAEALGANVGQTVEILVEGSSRLGRSEGTRQLTGRTRTNFIVNFDAPGDSPLDEWTGTLVRARVDRALPHSLWGVAVARERPRAPRAPSGARREEGTQWLPCE